jgi:transposase, IS5 family
MSDPVMEDALYDVESMRRFVDIVLQDDAVPDETTILNFRRLLKRHQLTYAIFDAVAKLLEQEKPLLQQGTIVDAKIIPAPPSAKNAKREHDPELSPTKKRNTWHFGIRAHIGVDAVRGIVPLRN